MAIHIDLMAQEVGRQAAQIASLAQAANCIFSQSSPADELARSNIVLNLLDVIEELAGMAECGAEHIEKEAGQTGVPR